MQPFPPIPSWEEVHPLVVHFPIALLIIAPLFVTLALVWKTQTRVLLIGASLLVVLGAAFALLATSTGDAAEEMAERTAGAMSLLKEHEELAETARNLFAVLAAILISGTFGFWKWGKRVPRSGVLVAGAVYLSLHVAAAVVLANAAHAGGRLVHEIGVRAWSGRAIADIQDVRYPGSRDRRIDEDNDD